MRPMLKQKLENVIRNHIQARRCQSDEDTNRMLLFVQMQKEVALSDQEKEVAQQTAMENLAAALRGMPHPPLRIKDSDHHLYCKEGRLRELVEGAYQLRNRASAENRRAFVVYACTGTNHSVLCVVLSVVSSQSPSGRHGDDTPSLTDGVTVDVHSNVTHSGTDGRFSPSMMDRRMVSTAGS